MSDQYSGDDEEDTGGDTTGSIDTSSDNTPDTSTEDDQNQQVIAEAIPSQEEDNAPADEGGDQGDQAEPAKDSTDHNLSWDGFKNWLLNGFDNHMDQPAGSIAQGHQDNGGGMTTDEINKFAKEHGMPTVDDLTRTFNPATAVGPGGGDPNLRPVGVVNPDGTRTMTPQGQTSGGSGDGYPPAQWPSNQNPPQNQPQQPQPGVSPAAMEGSQPELQPGQQPARPPVSPRGGNVGGVPGPISVPGGPQTPISPRGGQVGTPRPQPPAPPPVTQPINTVSPADMEGKQPEQISGPVMDPNAPQLPSGPGMLSQRQRDAINAADPSKVNPGDPIYGRPGSNSWQDQKPQFADVPVKADPQAARQLNELIKAGYPPSQIARQWPNITQKAGVEARWDYEARKSVFQPITERKNVTPFGGPKQTNYNTTLPNFPPGLDTGNPNTAPGSQTTPEAPPQQQNQTWAGAPPAPPEAPPRQQQQPQQFTPDPGALARVRANPAGASDADLAAAGMARQGNQLVALPRTGGEVQHVQASQPGQPVTVYRGGHPTVVGQTQGTPEKGGPNDGLVHVIAGGRRGGNYWIDPTTGQRATARSTLPSQQNNNAGLDPDLQDRMNRLQPNKNGELPRGSVQLIQREQTMRNNQKMGIGGRGGTQGQNMTANQRDSALQHMPDAKRQDFINQHPDFAKGTRYEYDVKQAEQVGQQGSTLKGVGPNIPGRIWDQEHGQWITQ